MVLNYRCSKFGKIRFIYKRNNTSLSVRLVSKRYMRVVSGTESLVVCLSEYVRDGRDSGEMICNINSIGLSAM